MRFLFTALLIIGHSFCLAENLAGNQKQPFGESLVVGLIGDSTVAVQSGWGPAFTKRFDNRVKILNFAKNGATLQSLSLRLDELVELNPDYVLIQFGHNDQKRYAPSVYSDRLRSYVERIRKSGGKAVIVSSVTRRTFNADGKIFSNLVKNKKYNFSATLTDYANAAQVVAKELSLPFIDLHSVSIAHHNKIGREESMTYNFTEGDKTHFSKKGAEAITDLIIKELENAVPELAKFLKSSEPVDRGVAELAEPISVRVAAYNVEFGKNASPEEIGKMFKPYNFDIIGFNEVPDGDWTTRVGKALGMKHTYVGKISSANHKDKYKSILSRTPLQSTVEHELTVQRKRSWNPASVVQAVTQINGIPISFYSLHICRSTDSHNTGHAYRLANEILPKDKTDRIIVLGDFNNEMGDHALKKIEQAGMRATWGDLKIDVSKEFTYNALDPTKNHGVIDHIFYSTKSKAEVTEGGIIELKKTLSDHKPIWAEIVFE